MRLRRVRNAAVGTLTLVAVCAAMQPSRRGRMTVGQLPPRSQHRDLVGVPVASPHRSLSTVPPTMLRARSGSQDVGRHILDTLAPPAFACGNPCNMMEAQKLLCAQTPTELCVKYVCIVTGDCRARCVSGPNFPCGGTQCPQDSSGGNCAPLC